MPALLICDPVRRAAALAVFEAS